MTFIAQTETQSTTKFVPFSTQEKVKKRGRKSENKTKNNFFSCKNLEPKFFEKQKQNQRENQQVTTNNPSKLTLDNVMRNDETM
jgi:hypothetical protein